MADDTTTDAPATGDDTTTTTATSSTTDATTGDAPLGQPGQKALDAMKAELKSARAEAAAAKALRKELDDIKATTATDTEKALAAERKAGADEANSKANARIIRAEVKAAAAGRLAAPEDAVALLDLKEFTVGDDGEVDTAAIAKAIDDLVVAKPYLAPAKPGPGSADGGARDRDTKTTRSTSIEDAVTRKLTTSGA